MPRASRYYLPGNIWHITHRCHNREFLFKHKKDRVAWIRWLYWAKKRNGICVLNYMVTLNHIHLLVKDVSPDRKIPGFMQLLQSRIAQNYNQRNKRKGAFWEDRYHATAVESDDHLIQCMVYISLNMVRAGVVKHPVDWMESGYYEIQFPRKRFVIIDYPFLLKLFNLETIEKLQELLSARAANSIIGDQLKREGKWTEAIAVGSLNYLEKIKMQLNVKARARNIIESNGDFILNENEIPYNALFDKENNDIGPE